MVTKAVEDSCRKHGITRVTLDELERIRARMPTPKISGAGAPQARPAGAEPWGPRERRRGGGRWGEAPRSIKALRPSGRQAISAT
jgi:hypothetical protein